MTLEIRRAREIDVPGIVRLIADDMLASGREPPLGTELAPGYFDAFRKIDADPNAQLLVADDGGVIGTLQLNFMHRLSRGGHRLCEIESVHVAREHRNRGIGAQMIERALHEARAADCRRVQLTSDSRRVAAHRFYERLGFARSHFGFKFEFR